MSAKKELLSIVRAKGVEFVGHRTNKKETAGSLKYVKPSHFKDRKGAFSQKRHDSFIFGNAPKTA